MIHVPTLFIALASLGLTSLVATADLIGYWPLDESGGTVAPNLAAGGTAGTLYNGATVGAGPTWMTDDSPDARGPVLSFDGTDDWVDAGTIPAMSPANDFTWSLWTYQQQGQNNDVIIGNRFEPGGGGSQWIKFTANRFEFHGSVAEHVDYADIAQNTWVHHALVKEGGVTTYYRNGAFELSGIVTSSLAARPFYLGGDRNGERWQGRLDDVAVFDQALTSEQVAALASGAANPITVLIPEPSALGLFGLGACLLLARRRR